MRKLSLRSYAIVATMVLLTIATATISRSSPVRDDSKKNPVVDNAIQKVQQGEQIFRFDTFGDEAFWAGTLKLQQAIEGADLGGVVRE